jgi:hypothetical protein
MKKLIILFILIATTATAATTIVTRTGKGSALTWGEMDANTINLQQAVDSKAPIASPTFTGTVVLPSTTSIGNVSATELSYMDGLTSGVQGQLDAKAASIIGTRTPGDPIGKVLNEGHTVTISSAGTGASSTLSVTEQGLATLYGGASVNLQSPLISINGTLVLVLPAVPASATATGTAGEIRFDANYMYHCVATNTWKRTAISSW